jgi:hypothetical protein
LQKAELSARRIQRTTSGGSSETMYPILRSAQFSATRGRCHSSSRWNPGVPLCRSEVKESKFIRNGSPSSGGSLRLANSPRCQNGIMLDEIPKTFRPRASYVIRVVWPSELFQRKASRTLSFPVGCTGTSPRNVVLSRASSSRGAALQTSRGPAVAGCSRCGRCGMVSRRATCGPENRSLHHH